MIELSKAVTEAASKRMGSLFSPAADIATAYHNGWRKVLAENPDDKIAQLIVAQSDAIKAGKPGPLSGGLRVPCF